MNREIPNCCWNCKHRDDDYNEFSETSYYFCLLNIWWPTKKQKCAKQEPFSQGGTKRMNVLCHACGGSGEDKDAERAASPGRCPNCQGTGIEPDIEEDEEVEFE